MLEIGSQNYPSRTKGLMGWTLASTGTNRGPLSPVETPILKAEWPIPGGCLAVQG